ncbi:long-chain fatty acid--CoA ligase [Variovorax saccharolyticus]|uniref:long-chain fatty acid--CoA ligase n=1 Tax=Variovorax saccharolyticus TaxID=3053516 RepID=UPI00257825C4|nr:long-chain fatty acid--CoA ligase [Variovorax sp. J22R187]MDM0022032.1 long-chain fatty acid--CoA ligase [Variovorax sp. J22R187]
MKSTMMPVQLSTNQILDRAGTYFGDQEVLGRLPDKSTYRRSYREIRRRARQLAQALRDKAGITRGDPVATMSWNHAWHLESYFGIPAAGAVLHTLNLRLSPEDIAYIMDDAGDRVLIVDDVLLPVWERVSPLLKQQPRVIVVPFSGAPLPAGLQSYEDFIEGDATDYRYPEQDENEAVGMCYTSGTTGRPKGVVYSHRSMVLHAITGCIPDLFALSARDQVMMVTPMFHANAWAVPFSAMMVGAGQVLPGPHLGGEDLLDLMEEGQVTMALGVPTIWMMIWQAMQKPTRERRLVKGMRMLIGGAAVPHTMIANFAAHDMHIVQGWGMTETSPLGSVPVIKPKHLALPDEARHALRAMQGIATPLVEMRIVDEAAGLQPWDGKASGEVQVRGPWVTGAYHATPDDPGKFTADGWLRTGDIGTIDPEGYMHLVDRSKDMIKSGGEWISSVELENLVMGHPAVAEASVVAIAHPKWGERPLVVAVRRPGAEVDAPALREFLRPKLARFQLPDDFEWVDAIPKTGTGKFLKTRLREMYRDRVSQSPD